MALILWKYLGMWVVRFDCRNPNTLINKE